jgi:hypothetical protein
MKVEKPSLRVQVVGVGMMVAARTEHAGPCTERGHLSTYRPPADLMWRETSASGIPQRISAAFLGGRCTPIVIAD